VFLVVVYYVLGVSLEYVWVYGCAHERAFICLREGVSMCVLGAFICFVPFPPHTLAVLTAPSFVGVYGLGAFVLVCLIFLFLYHFSIHFYLLYDAHGIVCVEFA
jgi:hypothetical protein